MRNWFMVISLALLMLLPVFGCNRGLAEEPIEIVYSGNLIGSIGPCNCPNNKAGGLPRRAYTQARLNSSITHRLVIDAGNFTAIHPDYGPAKTELLLAGMVQLGIDAINIGYRDLRSGHEFLEEIQQEYLVPFVSANVYDMKTKTRPFAGHRMIRLGASVFDPGFLVAVIGITDQKRRTFPGQNYRIEDPAESLQAELDEIAGQAQLVILMTDAERADIINWTRNLEGRLDLIVSSNNRLGHGRMLNENGYPLVSTGRQGKYFDRLVAAHVGSHQWQFERHSIMLDSEVPSDPDLVKYIRKLQKELNLTTSQVGDI